MKHIFEEVRDSLKIKAPLDPGFTPASVFFRWFEKKAKETGALPVAVSIERERGFVSRFETVCFSDAAAYGELNIFFVERLVKSLIWAYGGFKVTIGAPAYIGEAIKKQYAPNGQRAFDFDFVRTVYDQPLDLITVPYEEVPPENNVSSPVGRHWEGCRLGFDAGGSDLKVSAVVDGKAVFSTEIVWHPKTQADPDYHFSHIVDAMKLGASHMPRVDAVGISSAGVYINNQTKIASLFIKVNKEDFEAKAKDIYGRAVQTLGENIPYEVANDGDVTALAGSIDLDEPNVLGIAMGTSEAVGFVDSQGNITGWLNELAFVPCDFSADAMVDEWSGDRGCGVKYFSQDAVAKLAPAAGISFTADMTPAEKLKHVQGLMDHSDTAPQIFQTIGVYLGYGIAYYARLYCIKHILVLGRVTSGAGGTIILDQAKRVLETEFPELNIALHLPDESNRRVGQSIAAASLAKVYKKVD